MNQPHDIYRQAQISNLEDADPRMAEGWALSQLADRLEHAYNSGQTTREDILPTIRLNWQVWTIIQSHLVDENCPLPDDVRENLLSLTDFIDKQTVRIIGRRDFSTIPALININRQISAGLLDNRGSSQPSSATSDSHDNKRTRNDTPSARREGAATVENRSHHSSQSQSQSLSQSLSGASSVSPDPLHAHSVAHDASAKKYNFVRIKNS